MNDNNVIPVAAWPLVKAEPGTVISGTLRDGDLILAFANELSRLASQNPRSPQLGLWCALAVSARLMIQNGQHIIWPEAGDEMLSDLADQLDEFSPRGHSFGAHEGDGADFGYWPCEELE